MINDIIATKTIVIVVYGLHS